MKKTNLKLCLQTSICLLFAAACGDSPQTATSTANPLDKTYQFLQASICPVGSVIPYCGDPKNLPANWRIADGSKVDDPESEYFSGKNLPDMRDRFVMGASKEAEPLSTGGQAWLHGHTHALTGKGSNSLSVNFSEIVREGVNLDKISGGRFSILASSNPNTLKYPKGALSSSQDATKTDGKADNRPPFVALYYIIRIK